MLFILGFIVGILISTLIIVSMIAFPSKIKRTVNKVRTATTQKGSIMEPEAEVLEEWVTNLNEK